MITFLTIYTSKRPVSIPFKATSFRKFLQSGVGGLEVACWPLIPKFAGSNPAEARLPSKREVKPSVPCRRSLKKAWKSLLSAKFVGHFFVQ